MHGTAEPSDTNQIQEQWMKLAKTSVIAFALSAAFVGPVLAQGAATGGQTRGGAQERGMAPGGMTGGGAADEEMNAQTAAPTGKAGAKAGAKGTVGAGGGGGAGAHKGAPTESAPGSKRY
ncbi:hypothetical protein J6497_28240 [Bradyrhizobium sp. CNPSo 4026]|nr:hypothetical protein [Bradyrhizobium cenepequi]